MDIWLSASRSSMAHQAKYHDKDKIPQTYGIFMKIAEDPVIFINGQKFGNGLFNSRISQIKGNIFTDPAITVKEGKKLPQAPYTRLFDMDGRDFEITNKSS